MMTYQTIPTGRLDELLDSGFSGTVIDLRNRQSYDISHIKDAINIPAAGFFTEWKPDGCRQPMLLYCSRGGQSMMICNRLGQMGYQVLNVSNGIHDYHGKYLVKA